MIVQNKTIRVPKFAVTIVEFTTHNKKMFLLYSCDYSMLKKVKMATNIHESWGVIFWHLNMENRILNFECVSRCWRYYNKQIRKKYQLHSLVFIPCFASQAVIPTWV